MIEVGQLMFTSLPPLVSYARIRADGWVYDGRSTPRNLQRIQACTYHFKINPEIYALICYSRDKGHHSSGWWKNPDYEFCKHLSISFLELPLWPVKRLTFEKGDGQPIAEAFFGEDVRKVWLEGPYSPEGKAADVWHYRLFCNRFWQPIIPRNEVYSKEDTPTDWRSFSEVHGLNSEEVDAPFLTGGSDE